MRGAAPEGPHAAESRLSRPCHDREHRDSRVYWISGGGAAGTGAAVKVAVEVPSMEMFRGCGLAGQWKKVETFHLQQHPIVPLQHDQMAGAGRWLGAFTSSPLGAYGDRLGEGDAVPGRRWLGAGRVGALFRGDFASVSRVKASLTNAALLAARVWPGQRPRPRPHPTSIPTGDRRSLAGGCDNLAPTLFVCFFAISTANVSFEGPVAGESPFHLPRLEIEWASEFHA